jgi:signal transduction histidine kinase
MPPGYGWESRLAIGRTNDFRIVLTDEAEPLRSEYFQCVSTVRRLVGRYWFDALVVAGLGIGISLVVAHENDFWGPRGPVWLDIVLMVAIVSPFLFRRRFGFWALAAVPVAVSVAAALDGRLVPDNFITFLAGLAVVFLFAQRRDIRQAIAGLALVFGTQVIVEHYDPRGTTGDIFFVSLLFGIVWVVGFALGRKFEEADVAKERAARLERERDEEARAAVAEERARIARELHDVVGHSVSVMTVQASGVRRLLRDDQEREREALLVVERTGREALAEMRRMVGVLRRPEEAPALAPQPSLEHLERLVEQTRDAGLPVDLRVEGEAVELPAGVDLTAYRLVQEGLTNALKHAQATRAEVVVSYGDGQIEVVVSDDGHGVGNGDGGGHGLVGMRERVSVYGGELDAGPEAGGGYRLRARLPVTS